jgi:hypothetical protein
VLLWLLLLRQRRERAGETGAWRADAPWHEAACKVPIAAAGAVAAAAAAAADAKVHDADIARAAGAAGNCN